MELCTCESLLYGRFKLQVLRLRLSLVAYEIIFYKERLETREFGVENLSSESVFYLYEII